VGGECDEEELELGAAHGGGAPVGEVSQGEGEDERQDGEDDEGWGCQWGSAGRFCKDRRSECAGLEAGCTGLTDIADASPMADMWYFAVGAHARPGVSGRGEYVVIPSSTT
jgi:hypothetical protein